MSSLHKIIRKKYLACVENLKKRDLVTDDEYNVVSGCKLHDLLQIESTPSILDQICEGEKWHTAEYFEQQEKKYHIHVAKIYRKVKVKPTLPRIVEVEVAVPAPASDVVSDSAATPTPYEPTDAIRESPNVESNGQPRDPYQMVEETPQPEQPIVLSAYDDHFGSKDVDGTRDFLELCTGINFPPTTLAEPSTQQLLLAELGIPARPLKNNFQEIDLRGIGMPLFENPLETSTPFVEAGARRHQQPARLEQDVMPTTNRSILADDGQSLSQQAEDAPSVAMPTMDGAPNAVTNEAIVSDEIPDVVAAVSEEGPRRQETVQADRNGGVVAPERSSSSVSPVAISPPNPRSRRSTDLTRRLPTLEDILPRTRKSFDIFSYHQQSNLYPMIEYVQSQLFQQQPEPQTQPQTLVESSLVMRTAVGHNATREPSTLHESNDQASRDPFVTPAVETSNSHSVAHPIDLLQLPDQMQSAGVVANVPLATTLASLDAPMLETLEHLRLPSLVTYASIANEALNCPERYGQEAGVAMEPFTPQDGELWGQEINTVLLNAEHIADLAEGHSASEKIDTMLLDILILVQSEMCQHLATEGSFVPVTRLKELLNITARIDMAKIVKNIILLKQARLLDVSCAEDNSIEGVSLKLPPVLFPF